MNKWIGMGRATRDPEIRYTEAAEPVAIARFTLAIDRVKTKNNQDPGADFISIVAFGKNGEFAEKYIKKGTKIVCEGRIQTGSYQREDGTKVYTTDVVAEHFEFAESKGGASEADKEARDSATCAAAGIDGFMNIPDGIEEDLPFN